MKIKIVKLGLMDYKETLEIQLKLLELCQKEKIDDTLILVEHPPVITIGRSGNNSNITMPREHLDSMGVKVYDVTRGGDVTYHGPGQIVGYPIINLNRHTKDIKDFIIKIEEVFIRLLKNEFGIEAYREDKKYTGVWVGTEKITAIGIAVKKWVTMHGFAFNVNTNLDHFKWIIPCGIQDKGVTSLQKLTGKTQDYKTLINMVIKYFCKVFSMEPEEVAINNLI